MKLSKNIALALALMLFSTFSLSAQDKSLKFNSNHKFKIVQFTDVHWVYNDPRTEVVAERMNEVLDAEKPDLVVFTGDITTSKPAAKALDQALEPTIKRGIPFAITWGNHDDEQDLTREELTKYAATKKGSLISTAEGVTGFSNYVIKLTSADGDDTAAVLYFIDSNAYSKIKEIEGYDWIHGDQIEWYRSRSKAFTEANGGEPLPALAFFHIPIPEYKDMLPRDNALFVGTRKEMVCSPEINSGFGAAMRESGDVMGTFVGHDHVNDFAINWYGILLCYGRFTGGESTYHDVPGGNGARVIELTEGEHSFRTWIRLKGGKVINEIDFPADSK